MALHKGVYTNSNSQHHWSWGSNQTNEIGENNMTDDMQISQSILDNCIRVIGQITVN